jgi:transposase
MFTAPDELRQRLAGLSVNALVNEAARLRPRPDGDAVLRATQTAAVSLARRAQALDAELELLDTQIGPLVKATAPPLLNIYGVGFDTAAVLLTAAGVSRSVSRS